MRDAVLLYLIQNVPVLIINDMKNVIIQAYTNSEWDSVDGLLISKEDVRKILERAEILKPILRGHGLSMGASSGVNANFICFKEDNDIPQDSMFIETDSEYQNYAEPSQTVKYLMVRYYAECAPTIYGYGKHTDDEFWADLGYEKIKDLIK